MQTLQPSPPGERTHSLVLPAIRPRDAGDALVSLVSGLAVLGVILGGAVVPGALTYVATGSLRIAGSVSFATFLLVAATANFATVYWIKLDARGISLGRRAGGPRFVAWDDVADIRPASRREVIVDGWLWPPFWPREATRSISSLGHFRIDHPGGRFYYPPADPAQFLDAVDRWRGRHDASAGRAG